MLMRWDSYTWHDFKLEKYNLNSTVAKEKKCSGGNSIQWGLKAWEFRHTPYDKVNP